MADGIDRRHRDAHRIEVPQVSDDPPCGEITIRLVATLAVERHDLVASGG
jgi:hypothetical protein